jgi:hypothetical protein
MKESSITYDLLKDVVSKKGYKFYTDKYDLNIIGIRSKVPAVNKFCDLIAIAYINEVGSQKIFVCEATTEPGLYWLNSPMNIEGTAIVKEGQYKSMWQIGLHKGYDALVQIGNCVVYRDNDRDANLDLIPGTEETGVFAINMHRANAEQMSTDVNRWSAGCQVYADPAEFLQAMILCHNQVKFGHGDIFSYTLLNEADLGLV